MRVSFIVGFDLYATPTGLERFNWDRLNICGPDGASRMIHSVFLLLIGEIPHLGVFNRIFSTFCTFPKNFKLIKCQPG